MENNAYKMFTAYGIEAEYMIVDKDSLNISPSSDRILVDKNGEIQNEIEWGEVAWSNELAKHVIEIKTNGPVPETSKIGSLFHKNLSILMERLRQDNLTILPTAMHPWMNPDREFRLWTEGNREIYESYNRIFDCRGHGWSNLQSVHINLGFQGDEELKELHSAIRILLPLIPALSASSPIVEGIPTEFLDNRLEFYKKNQSKIPSIVGNVIPEYVESGAEYREFILEPMYRDILPYDPDHILNDEWLNSRGAITRFDRNAIEIRVMDIQESPKADQALVNLWIGILKEIISQSYFQSCKNFPTEDLKKLFDLGIRNGTRTKIENSDYLKYFGIESKDQFTIANLTNHLLTRSLVDKLESEDRSIIRLILESGNLSERILRGSGKHPTRDTLKSIYQDLNSCLVQNTTYNPL